MGLKASSRYSGSSPHTRGTHRIRPKFLDPLRFIPTHTGNTTGTIILSSRKPVHPHTHGEHFPLIDFSNSANGSSPHTRGTQCLNKHQVVHGRFIPTHTGNTFRTPLLVSQRAVHPHTHGEHSGRLSASFPLCGSSPHTRGTPEKPLQADCNERFIPTHTGNTLLLPSQGLLSSVHPHTHGEHPLDWLPGIKTHGSSPHTRGTPPPCKLAFPFSRFIPTHTGNTNK